METTTNPLNIDLSFKKNNVDELFFNLSENPDGFKNKDFRYTLSLIYQIIEALTRQSGRAPKRAIIVRFKAQCRVFAFYLY